MSMNETASELCIADFNEEARWCVWREEERTNNDGEIKQTKVPYCSYRHRGDCKKAQSNNPRTWITRRQAEGCWQKMQREDPDAVGGVGLFQGDLGDGHSLMGIDLDRCLNADGDVTSGMEIIRRFDTYAEVSPSGTGVKLFFLIADEDVAAIKELLGGKTRRSFSTGEHREIAFDTARFYAVTEDCFEGYESIRLVSLDEVRWFIDEAGPAYLRAHGVDDGDGADDAQQRARDESGSGYGFRFLRDCKQQGMSYEEARAAILADDGSAGQWARDKGSERETERAIKLAWDNAHISFSWEEPDISLLDDRRGELPAFPVQVLPSKVQDLVKRGADGAGCSVDYVAMPVLGIAAGLIGTGRRVRASKSWSVPHTLWVAECGFSGDGKTPGLAVSRNPLQRAEDMFQHKVERMSREHQQRVDQAAMAEAAWKEAVKQAAKQNREAPTRPEAAKQPERFIAPRLCIVDVTIEKMCEFLAARPKGMLLVMDELAGLLLNMSRYSGGQDNQFWLQAWDGMPYSCGRKNSAPINIPHLLVGIVGGIQPDRLPECFKVNDGMHARYLWSWPPSAPYRPLSDEIEECDQNLYRMFDNLARLGEDEHKRIRLSKQARSAFEELRKHVHEEKDCFAGREREWWTKIPIHVLRIAGTLCYMEWACAGAVPEPEYLHSKYVKAATRLTVDYLWQHARACLRQIGLSQRHADARVVLKWLGSKGLPAVRREDIRREALSQRLDAEQTDAVLLQLAHAGWLRRVTAGSGRGRKAQRWEVNPKLWQ
jgi:hypothetical protein